MPVTTTVTTTTTIGAVFSIAELGKLYNVSRTTIYHDINAGMLKVHKFGLRKVVIFREDAEAWAAARLEKYKLTGPVAPVAVRKQPSEQAA